MSVPVIKSVRGLAEHLGKSHTAIAGWLKDPRWTFSRSGPWQPSQIPAMKAWALATLAPDPAAAPAPGPAGAEIKALSQERLVKVALSMEKLEAAKLTRKIRLGEYHLVEDCHRRRVRQVHEVRTALLSLPDSLPIDADAKEIVRGRVMEICRSFAAGAAPIVPKTS